MSEYQFVEKPFLDQLAALGWKVIDQGPAFPTNSAKSLRKSFREIALWDIFRQSVRAINLTDEGCPWLTEKQLEELYGQIATRLGNSLLEANENAQKLLYRTQVDENELTGEQYPNVKLIDFQRPERNHFLAINQFRIDTPGGVKECIIPDIVLFVNGLPLVVVECKDANQEQANPMYEAFRQLMRYTDQREYAKVAGLREGEPKLFFTNQLLIRTCGDQAEFGTITSTEEEYFYPWRDIYPEKYRNYTPPMGKERHQELLIQGILPKETLLDIVRTCTVFMDVGKTRAKIVSRYQQYRATGKIIQRLRKGKTPTERSGVIWHTQGSGKSLTMVFVIRKLRMCDDLKDYKVCLINDRKDLEEQLTKTAHLTGEKVTIIASTDELREKLSTDSSNLNMVMVHKFQEAQDDLPDYLESVLERVPRFEAFGIVNDSERILLMIDEAHRTQSGDLGDNLFEAFPSATRLAFTGTPLIVVKDKKLTSAGKLPFKAIIHVAGINMFWRASEASIRNSVRNALRLAHEKEFKSIAFPVIGAGSGGFKPDRARVIMEDELGKLDYPLEVKIVIFKKLPSPKNRNLTKDNPKSEEETSDPRRWMVRQVARRLRYRKIDELIGRTITIHSLQTVLADIHTVMEGFAPNAIYRGPEALYRNGALAKYGLLDLSYDVSPDMAAQNACPGLSMLKELGIVSHSDAWKEIKGADPLAFLPEYLLEFDRHETILKLFLEEQPRRPFPSTKEGEALEAWIKQPDLIPFPISFPRTMEITDACVTNSDSVWLDKHFYM